MNDGAPAALEHLAERGRGQLDGRALFGFFLPLAERVGNAAQA